MFSPTFQAPLKSLKIRVKVALRSGTGVSGTTRRTVMEDPVHGKKRRAEGVSLKPLPYGKEKIVDANGAGANTGNIRTSLRVTKKDEILVFSSGVPNHRYRAGDHLIPGCKETSIHTHFIPN